MSTYKKQQEDYLKSIYCDIRYFENKILMFKDKLKALKKLASTTKQIIKKES